MVLDVVLLIAGGALLYFGAEWLVNGAAGIAREYGVSPFVIGATIVAYGTSAPELTVGVAASLNGQGEIALGNVVGSNIANIGLILGLTVLISPPTVEASLIRREAPVLLGVTLLLVALAFDAHIGRIEGAFLVLGAVIFSYWMFKSGRVDEPDDDEIPMGARPTKARLMGLSLVGMIALIGGGKALVVGASSLALAVGMSERTVGLTIVAVGTSLPELAASLVAAMRGHSDLAVGNVVGSNIFNILLIVGAATLTNPLSVAPSGLWVDLGVMVGMTLFALLVVRSARTTHRMEGAIMLAGYVAFIVSLFFR